jgi:hypothetical protein
MSRIDKHLIAMRDAITRRDWHGLEQTYQTLCASMAGDDAAGRIAALDFASYQRRLCDAFITVAERLRKCEVRAIYFEYDLGNDWESNFFLCQQYTPERERSDEWACEWVDECPGPKFEEACTEYMESDVDWTGESPGIPLFLMARTVAAYGRCVDACPVAVDAICIAFHDQNPVMRITETV